MEKENNPIEETETIDSAEVDETVESTEPEVNGKKAKKKKKEASAPVFDYDPHEEEISPARLAQLDFEYQAAREEAGEEEEAYGMWGALWKVWRKIGGKKREPVRVKKKTYVLLGLFLGFCGVHRFYSKSYKLGVVYAVLFWSGLPFVMAVLDIFYAGFLPADEEGYIFVP